MNIDFNKIAKITLGKQRKVKGLSVTLKTENPNVSIGNWTPNRPTKTNQPPQAILTG